MRKWMSMFMHRSMRGWSRFAKSTGLSMPQMNIMMQLNYRGPCGLSQISGRFDITAAAASQLVDKLVHAGYLERDEDPNDRRAKTLKLSPAGVKLVENGIQEHYRWMDHLIEKLNPDEQAKISEAFEILTEKAKEIDKES